VSLFRKAVQSTVWNVAGSQANAGLALISSIVIARLLIPEELGRYALSRRSSPLSERRPRCRQAATTW